MSLKPTCKQFALFYIFCTSGTKPRNTSNHTLINFLVDLSAMLYNIFQVKNQFAKQVLSNQM